MYENQLWPGNLLRKRNADGLSEQCMVREHANTQHNTHTQKRMKKAAIQSSGY